MTVLFSRRAGRSLLTACLMLLTLGTAGCGGAKGNLSGKVSYQGKPLALGSVLLIGADAKPRTTWIQEDGSYCFDDIPVGEAKLAVLSPDPAKQDKLRKRTDLMQTALKNRPRPTAPVLPSVGGTKWFAIPAEYSDIDHSGLHVTIHPGPNTYDIEMK